MALSDKRIVGFTLSRLFSANLAGEALRLNEAPAESRCYLPLVGDSVYNVSLSIDLFNNTEGGHKPAGSFGLITPFCKRSVSILSYFKLIDNCSFLMFFMFVFI